MNLFVTSECPIESAKYLDDKRVVKMTLETAQLLSTAISYHGGTTKYRPTHVNHPCSVWVRRTLDNWMWAYRHFIALGEEYYARYGRRHKSMELAAELFRDSLIWIPAGPRTDFINCARNSAQGVDYTDVEDVCTAYKLYLNDRWDLDKRTPTWYGAA